MNTGIALHLANKCPVGIARVHLTTGTTVDGQCLNATILQLFGQRGNDELFMVPTQTGLHRNGELYGLYNLLRNLQHLGDVLEHASTSTLACHFLDRTTEVEVDEVWTSLFNHLCSLNHRLDVTTIDLNAYRTLFVSNSQLPDRRLYITHQSLGGHEFRIDHRGTKPLAQHAEANIRDVLHRSQENGALAQFYIAYLHD